MSQLTKFSERWNNRHVFFEALLKRLCEQVVKVLRDNTPGTTLPLEWMYDITSTGSGLEARVWNDRNEKDPDFVRIMTYLDLGTVSHWIAPVNAEVLHWVEDGVHYFSKGHEVSGIRASDFSARAEIVILKFKERIPAFWSEYMSHGRLP